MLDLLISQVLLDQNFAEKLQTEVQFSICESQAELAPKINLPAWAFKREQTTYFIESPELDLYKNNLVFRVRVNRLKNKVEVALKKTVTEPLASAECEFDQHGDQHKLACKRVNLMDVADFEVIRAQGDWNSLLSSEQREWLPDAARLQITSGFAESSYTLTLGGREVVVDFSAGLGNEYNEMSLRASGQDVAPAQKELSLYLLNHGALLCPDQNSKMTLAKLKSFFGLP